MQENVAGINLWFRGSELVLVNRKHHKTLEYKCSCGDIPSVSTGRSCVCDIDVHIKIYSHPSRDRHALHCVLNVSQCSLQRPSVLRMNTMDSSTKGSQGNL